MRCRAGGLAGICVSVVGSMPVMVGVRLRHQHFAYLDSQMHKLADGRRHNVDAELKDFLGILRIAT